MRRGGAVGSGGIHSIAGEKLQEQKARAHSRSYQRYSRSCNGEGRRNGKAVFQVGADTQGDGRGHGRDKERAGNELHTAQVRREGLEIRFRQVVGTGGKPDQSNERQ